MKQFLKENWFVAVIAVFFICVASYFIYEENKNNLPSKTVGGKEIVLSIDGQNISADDIYDRLYKSVGKEELFLAFEDAVVATKIDFDADMKALISYNVQNTVSYYETYYGYGEDYLDYLAKYQYGYSSFYNYVKSSIMLEKFLLAYIDENKDTYYTNEFVETNKPTILSYCVISIDDPENPTEEELTKLKEAQDAWASDQYSADNFNEFAKAFSQDSNAENEGKYGYVDVNSSVSEIFKTTGASLNEGEVSDWVYDEDFGYFLIKCDSKSYDDFKDDFNYLSSMLNANADLSNKAVWDQCQKEGVEFFSEEFEQYIKEMLGLTTSESEGE